ncbi:hypothetical protein [Tepidibacter sp. Z1-5]|uniref:hypothetical protein n=1 Tax=Tepidibacter sp. Z1-5 TaxID=3134138 RepID=UPI0030BE63A7
MLDYKNENWWVYNLGATICLVGAIIVAVIYFLNKKSLDNESIFTLMNIQQIMLIVGFGLYGSSEIFAKNSRRGYRYYIAAFFTFIILISRNF